ncbi:MAG TPA: PilZ domain-containing protein [Pyrinomonadaceae bacterium]|nr:PilZ domain-containing protein [Pyrinomonadaceae bacterium]
MTDQTSSVNGERRDSDRKKLIVDVHFDGGDSTGIANTRDIGVGGLYMTTASDLPIGTEIAMTISVGGTSMRIGGVVVYADPGQGVGVRFRDVSEPVLEMLKTEIGG